MKVSIITSCFNRAATIRDAIESVLAQDYNAIEFIVVDGASTDGSLEIIREYEVVSQLLSRSLIMECMKPLIREFVWLQVM